jgi:hypothetical protein
MSKSAHLRHCVILLLANVLSLAAARATYAQALDFVTDQPEDPIHTELSDYRLVQFEQGDVAQRQPTSQMLAQADRAPTTARRPIRLASVPNMFGDFFGGGTVQLTLAPPPIAIRQIISDGPFDLFVTNPVSGFGANLNPAVPITILNGPNGPLVAMSIGNGIDGSGDQQPDTYPINEPNVPGVSPPAPGTGTVVFNNGTAVFVGQQGPNTLQAPADGSADRGDGDGWNLITNHTFFPAPVTIAIPPGGGAAIRRVKLAENNSPQPRCRWFFNYNFFNDVIGGIGDVNQYTFGWERLILDDMSIEVRLPFASTLDNDVFAGGALGRDTLIGNMTFTLKQTLLQREEYLISSGLGVAVPTSEDTRVLLGGGQEILRIESQAVHLLPFVALMATPSERVFFQSFLQLDIDANGNRVSGDLTGQAPRQIGVLQDSTLLFVDVGAGYLLYQNPDSCGITGISPVAELHYSTTLQDADFVAGNGLDIRGLTRRFDTLNFTLGTNFAWRDKISIRPAMVIPLRDDDDKQFDYEAIVQVNVSY